MSLPPTSVVYFLINFHVFMLVMSPIILSSNELPLGNIDKIKAEVSSTITTYKPLL